MCIALMMMIMLLMLLMLMMMVLTVLRVAHRVLVGLLVAVDSVQLIIVRLIILQREVWLELLPSADQLTVLLWMVSLLVVECFQ